MKPNVRLFRRIQRWLLKHPDQFEMDWWFQSTLVFQNAEEPAGGCGTAACLAGLAIHLNTKNKTIKATASRSPWNVSRRARVLLKINGEQGHKLFGLHEWPLKFRNRYARAGTPQARATAAVARIEHFLKTGE